MKSVKKVFNYFFAVVALFSIELVIIWLLFIGSFFIFIAIAGEIFIYNEEQFDQSIFSWIDFYRSEPMTRWMKRITFFGVKEFIFISSILLFLYFLFIKKHRWYSVKIPVVCIGCITINLILKSLFHRPRPLLQHMVESSGLSFPSGHAMISFSFYGLLIYITFHMVKQVWIRNSTICVLLVLMHLIGISRVYLRVHFPSDVIAGFALGTIWLILSIYVLRITEKLSAKEIRVEEFNN